MEQLDDPSRLCASQPPPSFITLYLMMAALSDHSNRNGDPAVEVGGVERIAYNLISRLILVSDPIFLFDVCSW